MNKLASDRMSPANGDRMSPLYISATPGVLSLALVWINPNPKPSRKKFRARLKLVKAA